MNHDSEASRLMKSAAMVSDRYKVVDGSESGHCCFEFTVVDLLNQRLNGDKKPIPDSFEAVCECFSEEYAKMICEALNKPPSP